ncbi:MAG: 6-bladed beta-propeller [Deltaproteobacteria bacterium]|nr:6-bladed beta-propeller [Deltaproteobacteria bacterium]
MTLDKRLLNKLILFSFIVLGLTSCAPTSFVEREVVWPPPPDPPKIKYIKAYYGEGEFKKTSILTEIVVGSSGAASFTKPMGVHMDLDGRIFVSDTGLADVYIMDPAKSTFTSLNRITGRGVFTKPIGIATDALGRIYATDTRTKQISLFSKEGIFQRIIGEKLELKQPSGIAVDHKNNRLFVADTHKHEIYMLNLNDFSLIKTIGKRGQEEGEFNFPTHLFFSQDKSLLYVTDTMNARIQVLDSEGRFVRAFGKFGDGAGMFARPKGVAVDSEGHVYVVDAAFNNIQIFDEEGQVLLGFSGYGNEPGQMILPAGIFIDKDDFIYVEDSWNERINVYEYLGEKHKLRTGHQKIDKIDKIDKK